MRTVGGPKSTRGRTTYSFTNESQYIAPPRLNERDPPQSS
jgi:hypothetical protein